MKTTARNRLIVSLLLGGMLISAFGCSKNDEDVSKTTGDSVSSGETSSAQEETELKPTLPDETFDGYTFKFLHWNVSGWESRASRDLVVDSEKAEGDTINDAVRKRNTAVSERFGIDFSLKNVSYDAISGEVSKFINSMDDSYDLVYVRTYEQTPLVIAGYFVDFNSIPYVDLTKPWWDQNCSDNLSIAHKVYLAASNINIIDKDATAVITFNKQMVQDLNLENFYQLVNDSKWTMDKMQTIYTAVADDLNGNGKMEADDRWGFLGGRDIPTSFFNGAGGKFASQDENGMPVSTFSSEYNYAVSEKIQEIMADTHAFYNHHTGTDAAPLTNDTDYRKMFENKHGLFFWTRLDDVTAMRASDTDFGILPIPKYTEEQEKYYNLVSVHTNGLMSVPITARNLERTGAILEALAYESTGTVIPAYYEISLKGKFTRDEESSDMLDLIFANRVFDIGIAYNFGGFSAAYETLDSARQGIASLYQSYEKRINSDIDKIVETINRMDSAQS